MSGRQRCTSAAHTGGRAAARSSSCPTSIRRRSKARVAAPACASSHRGTCRTYGVLTGLATRKIPARVLFARQNALLRLAVSQGVAAPAGIEGAKRRIPGGANDRVPEPTYAGAPGRRPRAEAERVAETALSATRSTREAGLHLLLAAEAQLPRLHTFELLERLPAGVAVADRAARGRAEEVLEPRVGRAAVRAAVAAPLELHELEGACRPRTGRREAGGAELLAALGGDAVARPAVVGDH